MVQGLRKRLGQFPWSFTKLREHLAKRELEKFADNSETQFINHTSLYF